MNNTSAAPSIYATSIKVLQAQTISNICWAVFCFFGLMMGTFQIVTTLFWKPLQRIEHSIIIALAIVDWIKTAGFGALAVRRLYETAVGEHDVSSQRNCMIWLSFMMFPLNAVFFLVIMLSVDRLLALGVPIWYKNRKMGFKLSLIGISVVMGCAIGSGMYIDTSSTALVPVCAFGTSPTETYREFAKYFEDAAAILALVLNMVSCAILFVRWRTAIKGKKDMKAFKKNVQLSALKVLLAVVTIFLVTSAFGAFWLMIVNSSGWDDSMRMKYTPLGGLFEVIRGVLDFPCYVLLVKEYRNGFKEVVLKRVICWGSSVSVAPVSVSNSQATNGTRVIAVATARQAV